MRIAQGLEAGGATLQGRTPLYLQMALADREFGLKQDAFNEKRMQLAQQLSQQRQQQQEKDEEQVLGIWKSNLPLSQKKKMSDHFASKGIALASNLSRLGNEHLIGWMDILGKYLPEGKAEELANIMRQPNADLSQVEPWIDFAEEKHKNFSQESMKNERLMDLVKRRQAGQLSEDDGLDEVAQVDESGHAGPAQVPGCEAIQPGSGRIRPTELRGSAHRGEEGPWRTTGRHAPAGGAGPCRAVRGRPSRSGSST